MMKIFDLGEVLQFVIESYNMELSFEFEVTSKNKTEKTFCQCSLFGTAI